MDQTEMVLAITSVVRETVASESAATREMMTQKFSEVTRRQDIANGRTAKAETAIAVVSQRVSALERGPSLSDEGDPSSIARRPWHERSAVRRATLGAGIVGSLYVIADLAQKVAPIVVAWMAR